MREIEVLLDQPAVGENLSDHAGAYAVWTTPEEVSLLRCARARRRCEEYEATQTGPFASNFAEAGGFARVAPDAPAPDIQFHVVPIQIIDEGMTDPDAHGMLGLAVPAHAPQPRQRAPGLQRPERQADRPPLLLHGRR